MRFARAPYAVLKFAIQIGKLSDDFVEAFGRQPVRITATELDLLAQTKLVL